MTSYLGVDWGGSCWVVVEAGDTPTITTEPSILNVWEIHGKQADAILIDIPIGLPKSAHRACDREAKAHLQDRVATVFSIPPREVVETDDYNAAREINDGSLGSQSWWLFPRIQEVDVFLQAHEDAQERVYESHPEVCFSMLDGTALRSKTDSEGIDDRLKLLEDQPTLHKKVEKCVEKIRDGTEWHERISKGRLDDVLDAAVLAYTAAELELGDRTNSSYPAFPAGKPEEDSVLDLPMEIVHPGKPEAVE